MPDNISPLDEPDMEGALAALIRAGKRAKLLAAYSGTAYVTFRDGEVISEIPALSVVLKEQNLQEGWEIELLNFAKAVGLNLNFKA